MSDTIFKYITIGLLLIQVSVFIVTMIYDLIRTKKFYDDLEIEHKRICEGVHSYEATKK